MSEEEVTCPKERLEEICRSSEACRPLLEKYEECARRVQSRPGTSENCAEELFELTPCFKEIIQIPKVVINNSLVRRGMSAPAEWSVKLRSVEAKKECEEEGKKKSLGFDGSKLKKAPKPSDFDGNVGETPKAEDNKEETVFEKVRAGLKKVPQK